MEVKKKMLIRSVKVLLRPTKKQEELMWKHINCSRFIYNWGLEKWKYLEKEENGSHRITAYLLRSLVTDLVKQENFEWLKEISGVTLTMTLRDLEKNVKRLRELSFNDTKLYSRHVADNGKVYSRFKSKRTDRKSFPVRCTNGKNGLSSLNFNATHLTIEKVGRVRYLYDEDLEIDLSRIYNARCVYDEKHWYLSFNYRYDENQVILDEGISVGVDVGIKDLAIASNIDNPFKNINKTKEVKRLDKKLKRLQRQVSRKYELNKEGKNFIKTKNILKLEQKVRLVYRRLKNIRLNYTHHVSKAIVETNPSRIVMENLDIKDLMKNKHKAKAIQQQNWYELRRQVQYKSENRGIKFILASRDFPSTKRCSCCGYVKNFISESERTYKCDNCGFVEDRDKNASYNLANYQENWRNLVTVTTTPVCTVPYTGI